MWINTRFQCSHWGNVILWSAVILNRALGEQLTPQLWLLAGVYSPSSPFSSKFLTAWGAWGELCHGRTISFSGINVLAQCWQYQEGWEGGSLKCYGVLCLLCTKGERSRWMNEIDTSEWPPSPGDWAHSACAHMCSLFLWVLFLLLLPHRFPSSSPCNQP